jgi:hypothetical protein
VSLHLAQYDTYYIYSGGFAMSDRQQYDEGFYKGLAEGHYQADSMHARNVKEMNKGHHVGREQHSCPSKMKAAHSAGKAYGGKAGLKK